MSFNATRVTTILIAIFFFAVGGYALFEARGILAGPSIDVPEAANGPLVVNNQYIQITGSAQRIATLTMNGAGVAVTESGNFSEAYILVPGYNRIVLDATDKYGKSVEKTIEIVYQPAPTSTLSGGYSASSTGSMAQ